MIKKTRNRFITAVIIMIGLLVILQVAYHLYVYWAKASNHDKVIQYVDQELTFEKEALRQEAETLVNWAETYYLTNGDRGRLYERASLIYSQLGEEITYYRYLGYALYYLEHSEEKDFTVNIYLDLASFYIDNISYARAEKMVQSAMEVRDFDEIEAPQIRSYAYRMQGIIAMEKGDYETAENDFNQAMEVVNQSNTGIFEEAYKAMTSIKLAEVYLNTDRKDEAVAILEQYQDSALLTQKTYRETLLRDFVIPYYRMRCYVAVAGLWDDYNGENLPVELDQSVKLAEDIIKEFMEICEENGYEKVELNTILDLMDRYPPEDEEVKAAFMEEIQNLYTLLFTTQNADYANIIESQVSDSKYAMQSALEDEKASVMRLQVTVLSLIAVGVLVIIFVSIINNNQNDGLTKVYTRKRFDYDMTRTKKSKNQYAIIMLDIDNFKTINDTFGHIAGDRVLVRLGEILQKENRPGVRTYRYGGEEFVLLVEKDVIEKAYEIAERIRSTFENEKWDFEDGRRITVSLGIAKGEGQADVVKHADENLYHSKQSGKNRITQ